METYRIILWCLIFTGLFIGWLLAFRRIRWLEIFRQVLKQTRESMEESARQRLLSNRKTLQDLEKEHSLFFHLEQELEYSGIKRVWSSLTVEKWVAGNLLVVAILLIMGIVFTGRIMTAFFLAIGFAFVQILLLTVGKAKALKSVDHNLLKFLDFLGNYSLTAGEITGIFHQVSKYMEEPLKSVLSECSYEAQTTGDASLALLSMAEKIEHPKFKELVQNMEISIRYCADFSVLVHNSKRSVREYLRMEGERKGMLREAGINMCLLLGLSVFVMVTVNGLIEGSIWHILLATWPGRLALTVLAVIFGLFLRQLYRANR